MKGIIKQLENKITKELECLKDTIAKIDSVDSVEDVALKCYRYTCQYEWAQFILTALIDNEDCQYYNENIIVQLNKYEKPLEFIYISWLGCDGALSLDWDDIYDLLKELYDDERRISNE